MGLIIGLPPQDFLVIKVVGLDIHWFSTFLKQTVDIISIYRVVCSIHNGTFKNVDFHSAILSNEQNVQGFFFLSRGWGGGVKNPKYFSRTIFFNFDKP